MILTSISPYKFSREYTDESVLLGKEATEFVMNTDTEPRSSVAGLHGHHVVKQPQKVPQTGERSSKDFHMELVFP